MSINTEYNYYRDDYHMRQASRRQKPSLTSMIDSDEDKILSSEELANFATEFNERTGNSIDITSIISQYDEDGDGQLSESEQKALNKERALEKLMVGDMQSRQMRKMGPPPEAVEPEYDEEILEKMEELVKLIDEKAAMKQEEDAVAEDKAIETESIQKALLKRLSQGIGTYEKYFMFENSYTEDVRYRV